jgi:hypothetical protein
MAEGYMHLLDRRWDIGRCLQSAAWGAYPVLAPAELSRCQMPTSNSLQEAAVELSDESQADWKGPHPLNSVVERPNVILHLEYVRSASSRAGSTGLEGIEFIQSGAGALDTGGENRLLSRKWPGHQVWDGKAAPTLGEPSQAALAVGENRDQPRLPL